MPNWMFDTRGGDVTPGEISTRKQIAQALIAQSAQTPANYWTQGVSNMVNALMGGFMQGRAMLAERANDDYSNAKIKENSGATVQSDPFGGSGTDAAHPVVQALIPSLANAPQADAQNPVAAALANPQTGSASPIAQVGGVDLITQHFLDRMRQAESGGRDGATNPNSSATGAYQFTNPTWTALMHQHPDLGLTADGRTDPQQSQVAAKQLATDNIAYLLAKGIQSPTEGQAYLAHFAGAPTAANLIQANPSTPVTQVMSPQQIAANPFLRNMTAGQVQDWATQKMGGAGPSQTATQNPQYSAQNPMQIPAQQAPQTPIDTGPSFAQLADMMTDPHMNAQGRQYASALLQNKLQIQQASAEYALRQADPAYRLQMQRNQAEINEANARIAQMGLKPQQQFSMLSPQEAQSMGLDPTKSYQRDVTGKISQIGGSGVNVSVNTGNGGVADAASKAYATKSGENLAAQEQDGEKSGSLMGLGKTLEYLAPQIGGGGLTAEMANRLGAYMPDGWKPQGQGQREQFQSLVSDAIRQSHVPGEGPQSDADAARLSATMPQIMNSTQGNIAIARTIQALAQRKMDIGKLAGQQGRGEITPAQRAEAVRRLPDPYAAVRSYWQDTQNPNQPAQQPGTRTTSTGVTWSVR
ncbi:lysozyme family protein [Acetobacter senegalensis]|uniref:hypothetical protein n=1 Tax=Acetobacter senegalensis TaxID=446692 RepID=UPI001EDA4BBA|nr:hypothetical protein [Acetobacter senegalensis]MCG4258211.1 hypothetical protein [Acetobacter senegalensis]MCG4268138.1 hypothetical protein [Acetobacter senegalensis]